jgi:RNA polymerase sigma factor (TIGR02999 family)
LAKHTPKTSQRIAEVLATAGSTSPARVAKKLMPLVYDELHGLAERYLKGESPGHTLQPTALVHEAYLRLVDQSRVDWQGRTHFLAVAAGAIRRILIDHARTRRRLKRGGAWRRVSLEDVLLGRKTKEVDFSELNSALDELAKLDADQAVIVELRFFGGLTVDEVAHLLGVSKRKVEGDWTHAKAWLRTQLAKAASE